MVKYDIAPITKRLMEGYIKTCKNEIKKLHNKSESDLMYFHDNFENMFYKTLQEYVDYTFPSACHILVTDDILDLIKNQYNEAITGLKNATNYMNKYKTVQTYKKYRYRDELYDSIYELVIKRTKGKSDEFVPYWCLKPSNYRALRKATSADIAVTIEQLEADKKLKLEIIGKGKYLRLMQGVGG